MASDTAQQQLARFAALKQPTPFELLRERVQSTPPVTGRFRAVLLSTGSMNPVHVMHLRAFDAAAKFLSERCSIDPVVGFVSPSSDDYVRAKLGKEAIPFVHRFRMCDLACADHNAVAGAFPVVADPWEGLQPHFVDFPGVRDRLAAVVKAEFPEVLTLYLCGGDLFTKCRLAGWDRCVAISRPGFRLAGQTVPARHVYICQDAQYADFFADVSSTEIRKRRREQRPIADLTYPSVDRKERFAGITRVSFRPALPSAV
jgi:nicotinic acid mononucleotide adenylyltransferase